jgi:hypothetical protein
MVKPNGISIPPARPCSTRNPMSDAMFGAAAHSSEPAVNASTEPMNSRLVPSRSAAQPVSGITVASAKV